MRKEFVLLLLLTLAACKPTNTEDGVKLKIIIPWINEELEGFLPVLQEFETANPDTTVEYQTAKAEDVSILLLTQFSAASTPADIIDIPWAWFIRTQAEKGHVLELNDIVKEVDFIPGVFRQVRLGSNIYGIPGPGGITVPEYRISFFQKHNLPSPDGLESYDKFLELLDQIAAIGGIDAPLASGGGVGWTFTSILETWILTFGGKQLQEDLMAGRKSWLSPEVRAIFERLLPLIQQGYFSEPDEYETQLKGMWNGKYGIFIGDSTDSQIVTPPEDRGLFLLPNQDTVTLWNDFWFIPKYTKQPEQAKLLMQFLSQRGQEIQIGNGGRIATNLNISAQAYPTSERSVQELLKRIYVTSDLDDTIGTDFQTTLWSQLALLWGSPDTETLDAVLQRLEQDMPKQ